MRHANALCRFTISVSPKAAESRLERDQMQKQKSSKNASLHHVGMFDGVEMAVVSPVIRSTDFNTAPFLPFEVFAATDGCLFRVVMLAGIDVGSPHLCTLLDTASVNQYQQNELDLHQKLRERMSH